MSTTNPNDTFNYQIKDTFVNYDTRSLLNGKEINVYNKNILFEVIKYYNNKDIHGDTDTKRKIIEYLHKIFKEEDLNYDKLMHKFNAQTNECLLAYILIAYKNDKLDLILRCMYTFGRVLPLKYETEWFDNYRLNNYGNPLNMVMWSKYDCDYIYTINDEEPLPINHSIKLPYAKVIKFLVGSLRAFIIDHSLYPENFQSNSQNTISTNPTNIRNNSQINLTTNIRNNSQSTISTNQLSHKPYALTGADIEALISSSDFDRFRDGIEDKSSRNLNGEQICDECYLHYPYYYGGAHGCDCFDVGLSLTMDEIKLFLERYPSARVGYILNTATYKSGKGEHWVALELTKGKAKLICSQQSDFSVFKDGGKLNNDLQRLMFGQEYNPKLIQVDNCNCGVFSSLALYELLCHKSSISEAVDAIGVNAKNLKEGADINTFRKRIAGTR